MRRGAFFSISRDLQDLSDFAQLQTPTSNKISKFEISQLFAIFQHFFVFRNEVIHRVSVAIKGYRAADVVEDAAAAHRVHPRAVLLGPHRELRDAVRDLDP